MLADEATSLRRWRAAASGRSPSPGRSPRHAVERPPTSLSISATSWSPRGSSRLRPRRREGGRTASTAEQHRSHTRAQQPDVLGGGQLSAGKPGCQLRRGRLREPIGLAEHDDGLLDLARGEAAKSADRTVSSSCSRSRSPADVASAFPPTSRSRAIASTHGAPSSTRPPNCARWRSDRPRPASNGRRISRRRAASASRSGTSVSAPSASSSSRDSTCRPPTMTKKPFRSNASSATSACRSQSIRRGSRSR